MPFSLFGGRSAQTVHPPSTLMDKRHILVMSINPRNDFYRLKLCRLSCTLITSTPSKIPLPGWQFFWACKTPTQNSEISHRRTLQHTDSGLLFQTWSKSVQDKCPKGCVVLATQKTKHLSALFGGTPGEICHTYIRRFIKIRSGLGSYNRKTLPQPQSEFNIGFF